MGKIYINKDEMLPYEKTTGYCSFSTLVNRYIDNRVLCNKILEIDNSIYDNILVGSIYDDETDEYEDIYQAFLCNIDDYCIEELQKLTENNNDIIIAYSDFLECNVLLVNHFGTSWDYVSTNIKITNNFEETINNDNNS